jgi:hypothetical protein
MLGDLSEHFIVSESIGMTEAKTWHEAVTKLNHRS